MDNIDGLLPVNCIFVEDGYDEAMKVIRSTAHARYPLCVEDKDHIIGLVHIKDLILTQMVLLNLMVKSLSMKWLKL